MAENGTAITVNGLYQNGSLKKPTPFENSVEAPEAKDRYLCSQRLILALVGLIGGLMLEFNRAGLGMAIVCMVNNTNADANATDTTSPVSEHAEFFWSKNEQAGILSASFYGYMVTQIPAGILAGKYGGKYVMLIGMLIGSISSLLLPIGARTSIYLVYVLRVILGASQGVYFPTMHCMWGIWAPPLERTKLLAICYSGTKLGSIAAFSLSGVLCEYGFDNGWPSQFYISGGVGVLWCGLWYVTVYSTPFQHPRISPGERRYIMDGLKGKTNLLTVGINMSSLLQVSTTPWVPMMTSAATLVCLVGHVGSEWVTQTLRTHSPTFMNEILKFDITENGLLSAVPYVSQAVSSVVSGQLADYFRSRKYLSTTATRRIFQTIGFIGTGVCIVCTGFVDADNRYVAVALLTGAMWFTGFGAAGFLVNIVDFAPRYSGVLFGVINSIMAVIAGVGGPMVAGALTPNKTQEEWRNVFYVCGGFCLLGTLVFGTQARGEVQPWAVDQIEVVVGEEGQDQVPTVSSSVLEVNSDNLEVNTTRISTHL